MRSFHVLILLIFILLFSCIKKEAVVKDTPESFDPATLIVQADQLYEEDNLDEAFRAYSLIYNNYPTSQEYIDASLGLSKCYNDMGEYEKGMDILYNLVRENIVPSRVPEIYNELAKYYEINAGISSETGILNEDADYEKAIEYYRKAIHYPNSEIQESKAYAQYRIGELNIALLNFKDAVLAFRSTSLNYPNTHWAEAADQRLVEFKEAVNNVASESSPSEPGPSPSPVVEEDSSNSPENQPSTDDLEESPELNLK